MIDGFLDTNVVIDLLRNVETTVNWYASLQAQRLAIIPIVWMETLQGARDKTEQRQIIRFLNRFQIEHPTPEDSKWAMQQIAHFHLSHNVGFQDVMIASVAVRLQVPIYTFNLKHFLPLPGINAQRPY